MKRYLVAAALAFGVVVFAWAQPAHAQEIYAVRTTVAFPFMVGNVLMPAGTYMVTPDELNPTVLEVRSVYGSSSAFAVIAADDSTARRGDCQFQFVNVGGHYYLTRIDDGTGDLSNIAVPDRVLRVMHETSAARAIQK